MLRGIYSVLNEIIQNVINGKLKYVGKIIKNRYRSVITNNGIVAFSNTGTTAVCFHNDGKMKVVKLRLKI
jgi:hypothetical protein